MSSKLKYRSTQTDAVIPVTASLSNYRFWLKWTLLGVVIFLIFLSTIDSGPYLHADEMLILDLGRVVLNPYSNWSIAWIIDKQQPAFLITYVGAVLQEYVYTSFGPYGPRILALLGAFAAATAIVGWLLSRGVNSIVAFLLGLIFLLDPLFVQSYTIGRVDGLAMFVCISSCWFLRSSSHYFLINRTYVFKVLIAGALASLAVFIWPSAVFLFPLIILELWHLYNTTKAKRNSNVSSKWSLYVFVTGGLIISIVLVLPIAKQLYLLLDIALESIKANLHAGTSLEKQSVFLNIVGLLRVLKFSPFLVVFAVIAYIKVKQTRDTIALLAVISLMAFTLVYIHRVQYLLPYLIVAVSSLSQYKVSSPISDSTIRWGLTILIIWSAGLSLGVRTYLALDSKQGRDRDLIYKSALSMIGQGNHRVYIPYEFYYSGRQMGWEMYVAYLAHNNPMTIQMLKKITSNLDYVIMVQPTKEFIETLIEDGWIDKGTYHLYDEPAPLFNGVTTNEVRVRNLYSIFKKPYGPYRLFARNNL